MGVWTKVKDFLAGSDPSYPRERARRSCAARRRSRDPRSPRRPRCRGVSIFHPRRFDEVTEIADNLRAARHVVVNLVGADRTLCQRIVDFLSGVVYTVDGKMQRLGEGIYLFVPANVPVTAHDNELAAAAGYEGY